MADDKHASAKARKEIERRPQDDYVVRLRPTPSDPPPAGLELAGVLGDSDRPGMRRLYLDAGMRSYVEFSTADVIAVRDVPPGQPPFVGAAATAVTLRAGAQIDFTRSHNTDDFEVAFGPPTGPDAVGGGLPYDASDACYSYRYRCGSRYCMYD